MQEGKYKGQKVNISKFEDIAMSERRLTKPRVVGSSPSNHTNSSTDSSSHRTPLLHNGGLLGGTHAPLTNLSAHSLMGKNIIKYIMKTAFGSNPAVLTILYYETI